MPKSCAEYRAEITAWQKAVRAREGAISDRDDLHPLRLVLLAMQKPQKIDLSAEVFTELLMSHFLLAWVTQMTQSARGAHPESMLTPEHAFPLAMLRQVFAHEVKYGFAVFKLALNPKTAPYTRQFMMSHSVNTMEDYLDSMDRRLYTPFLWLSLRTYALPQSIPADMCHEESDAEALKYACDLMTIVTTHVEALESAEWTKENAIAFARNLNYSIDKLKESNSAMRRKLREAYTQHTMQAKTWIIDMLRTMDVHLMLYAVHCKMHYALPLDLFATLMSTTLLVDRDIYGGRLLRFDISHALNHLLAVYPKLNAGNFVTGQPILAALRIRDDAAAGIEHLQRYASDLRELNT